MSSIKKRLLPRAILVFLFAMLLAAWASPAAANGKEDAPGQQKKEERAEEKESKGEDSSDESQSSDEQDVSDESEAKNSSEQSSSSGGGGGSSDGSKTKSRKSGSRQGSDPDPEHEQTPQATKGPTECPDYDDGDAGPYDHDNCDGSQGLHGNGGNGKCAGCTGKADDKWPGGQDVGDHNNGYECDHNSGVGKGNPAHSRCAGAPSVPDRPSAPDRPDVPSRPPTVELPDKEQRPAGPPVIDRVLPRRPITPDRVQPRPPIIPPAPQPPTQESVLPFTGPTDAVERYMLLALLLIMCGASMVSVSTMHRRFNRGRSA